MSKKGKQLAVKERGGQLTKPASKTKTMLAEYAKDDAARLPSSSGSKLSVRGKRFSYQGATLDAPLKVIILDYAFENAFYTSGYDPEDVQPPACFAVAKQKDDLAPPEDVPDAQADACKGCKQNEWNSSPKGGRGKACSNGVKLAILSADTDKVDADFVESAEIAYLRLAPTSVKHFTGYKKKVVEGMNVPFFSVVTALDLDEDEDYPVVLFQFDNDIDNKETLTALIKKREEAQADLVAGFDTSSYDPKKAGRKSKKDGDRRPAKADKSEKRVRRAKF